jgi:maltose alpha-D-glucosyltransferase / alpha-amylase
MKAKDMTPLFEIVFGSRDPDVIGQAVRDFDEAVAEALAARPAELREKDARSDTFWPKDAVEYMFYADQLGADHKDGTFRSAADQIPRLKRLGVDLLYPLPFLKSAGLDGGFDVMDFFTVEPRLGGNEAFEHFVKEARWAGLRIKMDLVLNHFSDQHPWFQALLRGEPTCRDCFITRDAAPEIVRRESTSAGEVVTYREVGSDGKHTEVSRRLIFPDIARTHYREILLPDGRTLWVYHTFYPFQLDLNYANPQVVREVYRIFAYWANRGIDVFRLDAIPFLDKTAENHPRTHGLLELFSAFVRRVAPSSRLVVEACQPLGDIVAYFGQELSEEPHALPAEAQMAYQFEGMTCGWLSLVSGDGRYWNDYVRRLSELETPSSAIWLQFLRVHDELTLEMVPAERKPILQSLFREGKGQPFRDGNGIAGRLAGFLGDNRARVRLAFAWLMSQDGMPIIYYGDEAAAQNNPGFIDSEEAARTAYFQQAGITALGTRDTRDLGRGPVSTRLLDDAEAGRGNPLASGVFADLCELISARKSSMALRRGCLRLAGCAETKVLAYWRECSDPASRVLVLLNLGGAGVHAPVPDAAGPFRDLISGCEVAPETSGGNAAFQLSPYEVLWLQSL